MKIKKIKTLISQQRRELCSRGTTLIPILRQALIGQLSSSCSDNDEQIRLAYSPVDYLTTFQFAAPR